MEAARHEFKLCRPGDDGVPLREKLLAIGKLPPNGPIIPPALEHVWAWFLDLSRGRTTSGWGPNPLSWVDINAWMQVTGASPNTWEINLLKRLDFIYLEGING